MNEDQRINLGKWILTYLFYHFLKALTSPNDPYNSTYLVTPIEPPSTLDLLSSDQIPSFAINTTQPLNSTTHLPCQLTSPNNTQPFVSGRTISMHTSAPSFPSQPSSSIRIPCSTDAFQRDESKTSPMSSYSSLGKSLSHPNHRHERTLSRKSSCESLKGTLESQSHMALITVSNLPIPNNTQEVND